MKPLNYTGEIEISSSGTTLSFKKCIISFTGKESSISKGNVFNSDVLVKNGYLTSSKLKIFFLDNSDKSKFAGLMEILLNCSCFNPLCIKLKGINQENRYIAIFSFDKVSNDLGLTDYLLENYNIGLSFEISLENGNILSYIPKFWIDKSYSNILTSTVLLEDLIL